jgi:PilZ domain
LRMSEILAPHEQESGTKTPARHERRNTRRVGVAMQVRLRTADPVDGDFEEIRTTQNASKKAIYFMTPLNGYYKGMRLRVAFPFDPNANTSLEQSGRVVRVHRRGTGFGVAVALESDNRGEGTSSYAQSPEVVARPTITARAKERRCARRSSFMAPVELIEMRNGTRLRARTADLSLHGCYVDTLNPLPVGSMVRLQIQHQGEALDVLAGVTSQHAASGMGVEFSEISAEQRAMLKSWLAESSLAPLTFASPRFSGNRNQAVEIEEPYAIRLINALVRKGILSKSEATELLRDPES